MGTAKSTAAADEVFFSWWIQPRNSLVWGDASTTDADATHIKTADGGFRPAYNVQLATNCASQVIVGVDAVTTGSDMGQMRSMVAQVEQRLGHAPGQWLVYGGLPAHAQPDAVADKTEVYAHVPRASETPAFTAATRSGGAQFQVPAAVQRSDHGSCDWWRLRGSWLQGGHRGHCESARQWNAARSQALRR